MHLHEITPLVLTRDEETNIGRTLSALDWAEHIIVLDSGSTDRTEAICRSNPRVIWATRAFDTHANQWNAGLALVKTPWVLTLDADYLVSSELLEALQALQPAPSTAGFRIPFTYCVHGRPLRRTLLPPRIALFRKNKGHYRQDGHTQDLLLEGECQSLAASLWHDDRKPFRRWWQAQWRYASLEAQKLRSLSWGKLSPQDQIRSLVLPAPFAVAVYCLFVQGLLWEGPKGWFYTLQRTLAEAILSVKLLRN